MRNMERVRDFIREYQVNMEVNNWFLDLVSEIGELGKEINESSDYGKQPPLANNDIEMELGDIYYHLN